jgi:hypothetical protein
MILLFSFFLLIIILYLIFILYVRLKYKFWSIQPVFHFYNILYWIKSPDIIDKKYPLINKYCNFKNIKTIEFNELSNIDIQYIVNFLRINFLRSKEANYLPTISSFTNNFINNKPSFVSIYHDNKILFDTSNNYNFDFKEILGIMTGKPVNVKININKNTNKIFPVYYIDYLCIDKKYRKSGLAPEIIQTHEWFHRHNSNIKVSLFKREGELTGIVPLICYTTYIYKKIKIKKMLDPSLKIILVTKQILHLFLDFIKLMNNKFYLIITPNLSNFIELIKNKLIYIYILIDNNHNILASYIFKNSQTYYKINNSQLPAIECICSISNCPYNNIFYDGFLLAYYYIYKLTKCKLLLLEDISHNKKIIKDLNNNNSIYGYSPTAYFFYNYFHKTIDSDKVLIIL